MNYKVNEYELCDQVVQVKDDIEEAIGMIHTIENKFKTTVRDMPFNDNYQVFEDKNEAIQYIIEAYEKLVYEKENFYVGRKLKNSPFDNEPSFVLSAISQTMHGKINYTVKNLISGKIQRVSETTMLYPC